MASYLALKRAAATASPSSLFRKLLDPHDFRSVSVASPRFFATNTQMATTDDGSTTVDVDRRSDRSVSRRGDFAPGFFSDVFDPFSPTRSLSQMLNMMDQMMENPFAAHRGIGAGTGRRGWDVREDDEGIHLRVDMPGVDKENVKISVEQNTLIIRGEGEKESEEDEEHGRRRFSSRIDLPQNLYKLDEIKAAMKNGVLKVEVPKVKEEDRKDVYHVKIE